jgi:hypothetical protein
VIHNALTQAFRFGDTELHSIDATVAVNEVRES